MREASKPVDVPRFVGIPVPLPADGSPDQQPAGPQALFSTPPSVPGSRTWLERLARLGYVARGVVYLLIGSTAMLVAVGLAEESRGSPAAMRLLLRLPLGRVLLAAVTAGLLSYALLTLSAAALTPEGQHPNRIRRWATQAADGLTGIIYLGLAAGAVRLVAEPGYRAGPLGEYWARALLGLPLGEVMLSVAGLAVTGAGLYLLYRALVFPFGAPLEFGTAHPLVRSAVLGLARAGTAARGVLFAICGLLALQSAVRGDPTRVGDIGDALTVIETQPAGPWLIALVGGGCLAYGLYQLAKARYRRIQFSPDARSRAIS